MPVKDRSYEVEKLRDYENQRFYLLTNNNPCNSVSISASTPLNIGAVVTDND